MQRAEMKMKAMEVEEKKSSLKKENGNRKNRYGEN